LVMPELLAEFSASGPWRAHGVSGSIRRDYSYCAVSKLRSGPCKPVNHGGQGSYWVKRIVEFLNAISGPPYPGWTKHAQRCEQAMDSGFFYQWRAKGRHGLAFGHDYPELRYSVSVRKGDLIFSWIRGLWARSRMGPVTVLRPCSRTAAWRPRTIPVTL
jgi:hypothetical protein